jgi:3-phenylpropionate/cinnamic acid dioxygenase small subunit
MAHLDEDLGSLKLRIRRVLHTTSAYAENPPSRVRRSITNVRVHETEVDGEYAVTSHLLVLLNRWDLPGYDMLSCRRDDIIRSQRDSYVIARRRILVDQATMGMPNVAILV